MALVDREKQQISERLDNMERLAKDLERFQTRADLGKPDKERLQDAEKAVKEAIPWVQQLTE